MLTLQVGGWGAGHEWPAELLAEIVGDVDLPTVSSPWYVSSAGVNVSSIGFVLADLVDAVHGPAVLLGRATMTDQLLDGLCSSPRGDVTPCPAPQTGELVWWRGSLLVRVLQYDLEIPPRAVFNPNQVWIPAGHWRWPRNEMWILGLAAAREGRCGLLYRVVDTSMAP